MLKIYFFKSNAGCYFWAMDLAHMISSTGVYDWIILGLFFSTFLLQSGFYLGVYIRVPFHKNPERKKTSKGVSIIICARNEKDNLEKFLPLLLSQKYTKFEIVVVNDRSSDESEELLSAFTQKYEHLRFTNIPVNESSSPGKKLALTIGLKAARYDWVLLTDADCYPASDHWLQHMASHLGNGKSIVLGYGRYENKKGILNVLIRYETLFTAMQYLSCALMGKPYMGVGRNLGYNKALFFSGKGFARHYHIASGDDDLFVNEHANRNNTDVEFCRHSHTLSVPESSFRAWIRQKQRHVSAGNLYKRKSRFFLATEMFSRLLLYTSFIILCFHELWILPVLIVFAVFQIIRNTVLKLTMSRLNEKYLLLPSFLLDPFLPLILGLIWFSNIFVTKYQPWS